MFLSVLMQVGWKLDLRFKNNTDNTNNHDASNTVILVLAKFGFSLIIVFIELFFS